MELRNKKFNRKNHKKSAMALVLIIIILTSLTFVIMGTIKLVTSSSGKFSINKNAPGVFNTKKLKGRYICFKYDGKLYQKKVLYNVDGTIMNNSSPFDNSTNDNVENCEFEISEDMSKLNVTLIGGGASGRRSEIKNIRYMHNKTTDVKFLGDENSIFKESNTLSGNYSVFAGISILDDNNKNCSIDETIGALSVDLGGDQPTPDASPSTALNLGQYFCYNDSNNTNTCTCTRGVSDTGIRTTLKCDVKIKDSNGVNVFSKELLNDSYYFNGKSVYEIVLHSLKENNLDNAQNKVICGYSPYYIYESAPVPPAGEVKRFTISKNDLKIANENKYVIRKVNIASGGTSDTDAGKTCFSYNHEENGVKGEKIVCTNPVKPKPGNSEKIPVNEGKTLLSESGAEADYALHSDFKLNNFDLHAGYIFENDGATISAKSATLFGSSGPVMAPVKPQCSPKQIVYGEAKNSSEDCSPSYSTETCQMSQTQENPGSFDGAPGAIIIEW